ncbi:MAG TPA: fumarylacetoacetate hydrolase family protein [Pyrinomonadaceae bacterium]|nr:fumarylacetoacetate hydrolase family protein [Pyrinomonadaceae bacterium]
MKIISFLKQDALFSRPRLGALLETGSILDFQSAIAASSTNLPAGGTTNYLDWFDLDNPLLRQAFGLYEQLADSTEPSSASMIFNRAEVQLLAPVPRPGKLICIGLNYRDHAAESNMKIPEKPVVFSKFTTSVIPAGQPVVLPQSSQQVDYEAELAVVIGRCGRNIKAEQAFDYVLGYTIVNDVSARDFQFADGQWQRGKSCDTFAPMGPAIVTKDEVVDPHKLSIRLKLNGQTMQDSNTGQLIFGVPALIEFLSETITLEPGDVIATGTPAGVGFARKPPVFLRSGDVMQVEIEKLGTLETPVTSVPATVELFARSTH